MRVKLPIRDMRCGNCPALDNDERPPCCIALDSRPLVTGLNGEGRRDTECLVKNIKESYAKGK